MIKGIVYLFGILLEALDSTGFIWNIYSYNKPYFMAGRFTMTQLLEPKIGIEDLGTPTGIRRIVEPPVCDSLLNTDAFIELDSLEDFSEEEGGEEFHSGKIYCANCIHCKLIPAIPEGEKQYVLRIRCAAGKWKKKLGKEKLYKYCTITRRCLDECNAYEEMGDTREFIRELKKNLSHKDEQFVVFQNQE
jgi:hypothetical protein